MFEVGVSSFPVYRDGISTNLTYCFIAVKDNQPYNCIVFSEQRNVIKFYPNALFWGVTEHEIQKATDKGLYTREDYQGIHNASKEDAAEVLKLVQNKRGILTVPVATFLKTPLAGGKSDSRGLHPQTSRVPTEFDMPSYEGFRPFHEPEKAKRIAA